MSADTITAQRCQECEAEYAALDGGVCASCKRSLCGKHFAGYFSDPEAMMSGGEQICDSCHGARQAAR